MYTLNEIKEKVTPIAKDFGIESMHLFGSYARGEQNENSDLDFIIDSGDVNTYFKIVSLIDALEKQFKCHVDLITEGIEDKDFLHKAQKESKELYVRN